MQNTPKLWTEESIDSYVIVRSTADNMLFCVIAVDDKQTPLFAELVDVTLEEASNCVEHMITLRSTQV